GAYRYDPARRKSSIATAAHEHSCHCSEPFTPAPFGSVGQVGERASPYSSSSKNGRRTRRTSVERPARTHAAYISSRPVYYPTSIDSPPAPQGTYPPTTNSCPRWARHFTQSPQRSPERYGCLHASPQFPRLRKDPWTRDLTQARTY